MTAGIEDLREKREEVSKQIKMEEEEKVKIQNDLQVLTKRLAAINDTLARKVRSATARPWDASAAERLAAPPVSPLQQRHNR